MLGKLRRFDKTWGHELWIHNSPMYCGKVLVLMPDKRTSFHYHVEKHETFCVVEGLAMVWLGERVPSEHYEEACGEWHIIEAGTTLEVPPQMVHAIQNIGESPLRLIEVSTFHRDSDSYRLLDACIADASHAE